MIKKMSIRMKITVITIALLTLCCISLTAVLNRSAYKMATQVQEHIQNELSKDNSFTKTEPVQQESEIKDYAEQSMIPSTVKTGYRLDSLVYMILFIIGGGAIMYGVIHRILKPIDELTYNMKSRTIDNLAKKIPLKKQDDEINYLIKEFNDMTSCLNEAFLMQKRFSNNAAHELRTPLTVLRTNIDVFKKKKDCSIDEYKKLIDGIQNQVIRLSDLVGSLLKFTQLGEIQKVEEIEIAKLISLVCSDLRSIADKRHIKIYEEGKEGHIQGDQELLYQVFYNLIENAIRYSEEYGNVWVSIKNTSDIIQVDIADSGIGISDEMKEHIFEPFFTVDKSRSRSFGGAGIGLSIVKNIVEKHNGDIKVKDRVGGGTVFKVILKKYNSSKHLK